MPPKKKGGKKANDDWDEGLGEVADPIAAAVEKAKASEKDVSDDEPNGGGGLLAALKKNRGKKAKKGKVVEDFVDGEDPPTNGLDGDGVDSSAPEPDADASLAAKAPVEASIDDEFDIPAKKGKAGQAKEAKKETPNIETVKQVAEENEADEDDEDHEEEIGGKVKSKKEKEKEKKEREKQRKKEQV